MTSIVDPAEQDGDLSETQCATGVAEGYRQIVNACSHDPELFVELVSKGTIKYRADSYVEVVTDDELRLLAAARALMRADGDMMLEAGGDMTLKVGGNLNLDVTGNIIEKSAGHVAGFK